MTDRLKDIPTLDREGRNLKQWGDAVLEALQTFRGTRGDKLDKALTLRDALKVGLLGIGGGGSIGLGDGVGSGTGGTGGPGSGAPDLTPPPTPEGLALASGFANLFIEWNAPVYLQGHGHKKTNIYGAKYAIPGALPTFTNAVRIGEAWDSRTLYAHPTELGTNWAIWITFESIDGVESVTPAGGANGVRQTVGKIGNSDLGPLIVEAENLANGSVTGTALADKVVGAAKLGDNAVTARTLVITDFQNLCTNGMGLSTDGWSSNGAFIPVKNYGINPAAIVAIPTGFGTYWSTVGVKSDSCMLFSARDAFYGAAFPVKVGEEFACSADITPRGGGTGNLTTRLSVAFFNATGAAVQFGAAGSEGAVYGGGAVGYHACSGIAKVVAADAAFGLVWVQVDGDPASTNFMLDGNSYHYTNMRVLRRNAGQLIVDGGITANHLAANSIAVGSAAIQDGAIRNALIANLAVDNAKVANLSANKLSVGDGIIGGLLRSANYAAGSAGWVVQPNGFCEFSGIVARGTIYANAGQIGGITISGGDVRSPNYVPLTTGFRINADGSAEFYNVTARGNITANSLNAATGTFSGTLSSVNGTFTGQLVGAIGTFSGSLTAAAISAVDTINLAGNAVTVPITGNVSGTGRATVVTTSRTSTVTIGSISTSAQGQGRITLLLSPRGISAIAQWWIYSYLLGEASLSDNGSFFTFTFKVRRTIGGTTTDIWTLSTSNPTSGSGTSTRFLHAPLVLDTPGPGVTAVYSLEITTTSGTATNHSHEMVDFSYVLTESKR